MLDIGNLTFLKGALPLRRQVAVGRSVDDLLVIYRTQNIESLLSMNNKHTHTHPKQSNLPITRVSTCTHRSSIFQQVKKKGTKVQVIKFNPTDKIPMHEHLYSDQYYHINSIANPHIETIN